VVCSSGPLGTVSWGRHCFASAALSEPPPSARGVLGVRGVAQRRSLGAVGLDGRAKARAALLRSVAFRALRQFTWLRRMSSCTSRRFCSTWISSSSLLLRWRLMVLRLDNCVSLDSLLGSEHTLMEVTEGSQSSRSGGIRGTTNVWHRCGVSTFPMSLPDLFGVENRCES